MQKHNSAPVISLKDYLSVTKDVAFIAPAMENLSEQLRISHSSYPECGVDNMTSSTIGFDPETSGLYFSSFVPMDDNSREAQILKDKQRFAKVMLQSYMTCKTGQNLEHTQLPNEFISANILGFADVISDEYPSSYLKQCFGNNDWSQYYHEHVRKLTMASSQGGEQGKGGTAYVKATQAGTFLSSPVPEISSVNEQNEKQAAFINVIFYPALLLVLTIVMAVIYKCITFIGG